MLDERDLEKQTEVIKEHIGLKLDVIDQKLAAHNAKLDSIDEKNESDHAALFVAVNGHSKDISAMKTDLGWYKRIGVMIAFAFSAILGVMTFWKK